MTATPRIQRAAFVAICVIATAAIPAGADRIGPPPVIVEATLIEAGPPVPACGRVHSIGVARYQLRRAVTGNLSDAEFWVAFSCRSVSPRDVGRVFELHLSRSRPWASRAVFWPHGRARAPLFYAVRSPTASSP